MILKKYKSRFLIYILIFASFVYILMFYTLYTSTKKEFEKFRDEEIKHAEKRYYAFVSGIRLFFDAFIEKIFLHRYEDFCKNGRKVVFYKTKIDKLYEILKNEDVLGVAFFDKNDNFLYGRGEKRLFEEITPKKVDYLVNEKANFLFFKIDSACLNGNICFAYSHGGIIKNISSFFGNDYFFIIKKNEGESDLISYDKEKLFSLIGEGNDALERFENILLKKGEFTDKKGNIYFPIRLNKNVFLVFRDTDFKENNFFMVMRGRLIFITIIYVLFFLLLLYIFISEKEIENIAMYDYLTNIYNRYMLVEILRRELKRISRYNNSIVLIMMDLDNFKLVNDKYGHQKGDEVLRKFSKLVQKNIRAIDIFARWGGDEFFILMPDTRLKNGLIVAEKLRKLVLNSELYRKYGVSLSIGVIEVDESYLTLNDILQEVDEHLYNAKKRGKNRIE